MAVEKFVGRTPPQEFLPWDLLAIEGGINWTHWALVQFVHRNYEKTKSTLIPQQPEDGIFEGYDGQKHEWLDGEAVKRVVVGVKPEEVSPPMSPSWHESPVYILATIHQDTDIDSNTRLRRHREALIETISSPINPERLVEVMGRAFETANSWKIEDLPRSKQL